MSESLKFQQALSKATNSEKETSKSSFISRKRKKSIKPKSDIEKNPFAVIVSETADPEAQKEKMVELMTYVDAKTTAENSKALSEYTEYMQSERQRLALELIEMTDTKTFSNMQSVLMDINNGVLDFEEQIKPFMEIINAVRLIQEEDATTDIISEMREDDKASAKRDAKIKDISNEIRLIRAEILRKQYEIENHVENRSFFGFGNTKKSSLDAIEKLNAEIANLQETVAGKQKEASEIHKESNEESSKFAHLKEAKKVMSTMLNLSAGEHEEKHEKLIKTAVDFVNTTKERVTDTLGHSVKMNSQIKNLSDLAFTMRGSYSVLSEAAKKAELVNSKAHDKLKEELSNIEDPLTKLNKEKVSREMSKHITTLNDAARETTDVISDLTISSQRIETMEAANIAQIKKTEQIQTSGIAGVADNLSSVLTAIGQAATQQASTAAQQSLRRMNTNTLELTKESMLNAAKSQNDDNAALIKSLEQLSNFGEVIELANESTRTAIEDNREIISNLREVADEVSKSASETLDIVSSTISEEINS